MKEVSGESYGLTKVAIAQISATVLGAVFWLLFATIIHPIAYGRLAWLVSIAMLLSTLCLFGLGKTIATYYPKEGDDRLLTGSVLIVLISSLAVGGIVSVVLNPFVGLLTIALSFFSIAFYSELAKRQYKNYMWMWIGVRSASLVIPVIMYYLWGLVAGILAGLAAAYFIFGS